jgi:hypothetical protein
MDRTVTSLSSIDSEPDSSGLSEVIILDCLTAIADRPLSGNKKLAISSSELSPFVPAVVSFGYGENPANQKSNLEAGTPAAGPTISLKAPEWHTTREENCR